MIKYDVLNRITGGVQFTAEIDCSEDSEISLKKGLSVKWAIKNNIDLRYADLSNSNLRYANLSNSNLRYADLRYADLSNSDLRYADLSDSDLRYADLSDSDLSDSDLSNSNLRYADLSDSDLRCANLRVLQTDKYTCWIQKYHIRIGCKYYCIEEWKNFNDDQIAKMDTGALEWWKIWKPIIMQIHSTIT